MLDHLLHFLRSLRAVWLINAPSGPIHRTACANLCIGDTSDIEVGAAKSILWVSNSDVLFICRCLVSDQFCNGPCTRSGRRCGRIFSFVSAVEQQALARNPADALKRLPKVERKPPATLTVEQSQRLLTEIKHTTTYWPVLLALATGLRPGEILALRWCNVDLDRGAIRVVDSLEQTKAGLRFKSTKSDKGRGVALPSFAIAELRRHKQAQAEALLALGVRQSGDTWVCGRVDGEPKQPASLTHEFTYLRGRIPAPHPCNAVASEWSSSEGGARAPGPFDNRGHDGHLFACDAWDAE